MACVTTRITFMGDIRKLAGRREMEVTLAEGSSLSDLLGYLCESLGEAFAKRLFDRDGSLYRHVIVSVNGTDFRQLGGLQTSLAGGEIDILILPVWDGG